MPDCFAKVQALGTLLAISLQLLQLNTSPSLPRAVIAMSRTALAAQSSQPAAKGDLDDEGASTKCPACQSDSRYTRSLRFKVNPKCYHRVCEGCIDRHFASGKAKCPVAKCKQEIWKSDWRTQTFEDLRIEKEVDKRKRVYNVLNRREEEFLGKREWDDFLELREELVMNLSLGTDVAATNKRLKEYEVANAAGIKENVEHDRTGAGMEAKHKSGGPDSTGLVKGLKALEEPEPEVEYDAFMGMPRSRGYYEVRQDYPTSRLRKAKEDARTLAGGFDFQQYYDESLLRAFAGLECFIEDEKAEKLPLAQVLPVVASNTDDVF